jgi:hypothetical protein
MFPIMCHIMSHKIVSISGDFILMILQKISTNKRHNRNSWLIARKFSTKNYRQPPTMIPFSEAKLLEKHDMFV